MKNRKVKAWALVSRGGVLLGGGTKNWGYTPLCVYSTRQGAKEAMTSSSRENDVIVKCEVVYSK